MKVYLIIAIDKNGAMGKDNKLPWHLPEDLKHFKSVTDDYPLIMGANTFNSLPGVLPNREHIVLSRTMYGDENKSVFTSIKEALDYCRESEYEKCFVIGGANIIKQFNYLNLIDELIITHVDCTVEDADTYIDIYEDLSFHRWTVYDTVEYNESNIPFKIKKYKKIVKRFY